MFFIGGKALNRRGAERLPTLIKLRMPNKIVQESDYETYLTLSDSYSLLSGIQSLIRVGNLSAPNLFSALPPVIFK